MGTRDTTAQKRQHGGNTGATVPQQGAAMLEVRQEQAAVPVGVLLAAPGFVLSPLAGES